MGTPLTKAHTIAAVATGVSDHVVKWRSVKRVLKPWQIPVLIFVVLCLAGATTSSLGILSVSGTGHSGHQIGASEPIRSDDYLKGSPIVIGWITTGGANTRNPLASEVGFSALQPTGPASDLVFFDASVERLGKWLPAAWFFAASWWLPTLLLWLGLPPWFRRVTGSARWGYMAAALISLSPANTWWSLSPTEPLGFAFSGSALALCSVEAWAKGRRGRGALLSLLSAVLIARLPFYYQPWVIVLAAPVLLATAVHLLGGETPRRVRATVGVLVAAVALLLAGLVALENLGAIRALADAVYPGQRVATASAVAPQFVFGATALGFLADFPGIVGTNQSEASSSFTFLIIIVGLLLLVRPLRRRSRSYGAFLVFFGFTVLWLLWSIANLGLKTGHIPILSLVPANRAAQVVGFLAVVAFCIVMADWSAQSERRRAAAFSAVVAGGITLYTGSLLRETALPAMTSWMLVVSTIVAGYVIYRIIATPQSRWSWACVIGAAALSVCLSSPLTFGLGDLHSSAPAKSMLAHAATARAAGRLWASDSSYFDALAAATGTPSLSGYILNGPDASGWRALDPTGRHKQVWDRGGGTYIQFVWTNTPRIGWANSAPDQIQVSISPCVLAKREPRLSDIVSYQPLSAPCLRQVDTERWMGQTFLVYRVKRATPRLRA